MKDHSQGQQQLPHPQSIPAARILSDNNVQATSVLDRTVSMAPIAAFEATSMAIATFDSHKAERHRVFLHITTTSCPATQSWKADVVPVLDLGSRLGVARNVGLERRPAPQS